MGHVKERCSGRHHGHMISSKIAISAEAPLIMEIFLQSNPGISAKLSFFPLQSEVNSELEIFWGGHSEV